MVPSSYWLVNIIPNDGPLVCDALKMALWRRKQPTGALYTAIAVVNTAQQIIGAY